MINVSARIKKAFQNDSMPKHYYINFPNIDTEKSGYDTLTNSEIVEDSFKLSENLNSEDQLHYGRCEGNMIEFEMVYNSYSIIGEIIDVYLILGDYYYEPFVVGRYIVSEEKVSNDRKTKSITAYDILSILNELDVTYWCYTLTFPMTLKQLRDSLLEYVGQNQVEATLINDSIIIYENPWAEQYDIKFNSVMSSILEWSAVFGGVNRSGLFCYTSLSPTENEETYPSAVTFPSNETYPQSIRGKNYYIDPHLIKDDITWENYICKPIDIVQVRNTNGAPVLDYKIPEKTGENIYVIQGNCFVDLLDSTQLLAAVQRFAEAVYKIYYTPCTANVKMDLSYEVGDAITLTTTDGTRIPTFILKRVASGGMSAFDEFEATGNEEFINDIASDDSSMYDELEDEIEDLDDRLTDVETDGGITIISVRTLPEAPKKNVLYLIQGDVWVT